MTPRAAREVDRATREVVDLLAVHDIRLTPALIEAVRLSVARAVLATMPRHAGVVPRTGPWDDETQPQWPGNKRLSLAKRGPADDSGEQRHDR